MLPTMLKAAGDAPRDGGFTAGSGAVNAATEPRSRQLQLKRGAWAGPIHPVQPEEVQFEHNRYRRHCRAFGVTRPYVTHRRGETIRLLPGSRHQSLERCAAPLVSATSWPGRRCRDAI
jgi:hypothetical protein